MHRPFSRPTTSTIGTLPYIHTWRCWPRLCLLPSNHYPYGIWYIINILMQETTFLSVVFFSWNILLIHGIVLRNRHVIRRVSRADGRFWKVPKIPSVSTLCGIFHIFLSLHEYGIHWGDSQPPLQTYSRGSRDKRLHTETTRLGHPKGWKWKENTMWNVQYNGTGKLRREHYGLAEKKSYWFGEMQERMDILPECLSINYSVWGECITNLRSLFIGEVDLGEILPSWGTACPGCMQTNFCIISHF